MEGERVYVNLEGIEPNWKVNYPAVVTQVLGPTILGELFMVRLDPPLTPSQMSEMPSLVRMTLTGREDLVLAADLIKPVAVDERI